MDARARLAAARLRLAVALDFAAKESILSAAALLSPETGVLKVGLQAFVSHGPELVRELAAAGARVFLDLKLHDIPNTVGAAARAAATTGASILNVHAAGGLEMMRAAKDGALAGAATAGHAPPRVIAVTILTSLDAPSLQEIGFALTPRDAAVRLAACARRAGLDGVVCSPEEISAIRAECGPDFLLVVPGIRPAGSATDDQKRISTPGDAIRAGADLLVVGRPITGAEDPVAAARSTLLEIALAIR